MSLTESPPAVAEPAPQRWWAYGGSGLGGRRPAEVAEYVAMAVALAALASRVTPGQGGLDPGRLRWGLLSVLPAVIVTLPWRRVAAVEWAAVAALAGSAVVIAVTSPTGWTGALQVGGWAYAAAMFLAVRSFCTDDRRRSAVVVGLAVVGLEQFSRAWLPWWGGRDPAKRMIGTFYWHNQFAAYVLGAALVAIVLVALLPASRARLLAAVCAPFCVAGVVFSTSRACLALLAAGLTFLLARGVHRRDWMSVRRVVLVSVGSAALAVLMSSTLVFPGNGGSPFGATARRASEEGLVSNGAYRFGFWEAAWGAWLDRPVLGAGFESFAQTSAHHMDPGAVRSPSAHNGVLQALAEGGLVHGLVVIAILAALLWAATARLRDLWSSGRSETSPVAAAAALGLGALLLHAVTDFDWFFPSLLALTAALAAVAVRPRPPRGAAASFGPVTGAVAVAAMLAVSTAAVWRYDRMSSELFRVEVLARTDRTAAAEQAAALDNPLRDPRPWVLVLDNSVIIGGTRPKQVPEAAVRTAIRRTEQLAEVDPAVAVQRQLARYMLGEQSAVAALRELVHHERVARPRLYIPLARVLADAGDHADARRELVDVIGLHVRRGHVAYAAAVWELVRELDRLDGSVADYRCAYAATRQVMGPPPARPVVRRAGPAPDPRRCEDLGLTTADAFSPAAFWPMGDDRDLRRTEGL